eukprot:scaffold4621_cov194-Alexandrium_tamarense.AAC.4
MWGDLWSSAESWDQNTPKYKLILPNSLVEAEYKITVSSTVVTVIVNTWRRQPSEPAPSQNAGETNQQQRNHSTKRTVERVFSQVERIIETDWGESTLED